jgi:hypothetical protein
VRSETARTGTAADFGEALLDAATPTPGGIVGPDGKPAPKRFNVYRNNVLVSLTEALADTFPAIERLLGEDYFKALAKAFILDHPPRSPVLIWYGDAFADFLETFPPLAGYPYLADVARLEWAWLAAYHAADAEPLDPAILGTLAADRVVDARFLRHPATHCLRSKWPVLSLVLANRFATDAPPDVKLDIPESVLITRPDLDVQMQLMRPGGDVFFEALGEGTLQMAAEAALTDDAAFQLSECLSDILTAGAFSDLELDGEPMSQQNQRAEKRG